MGDNGSETADDGGSRERLQGLENINFNTLEGKVSQLSSKLSRVMGLPEALGEGRDEGGKSGGVEDAVSRRDDAPGRGSRCGGISLSTTLQQEGGDPRLGAGPVRDPTIPDGAALETGQRGDVREFYPQGIRYSHPEGGAGRGAAGRIFVVPGDRW